MLHFLLPAVLRILKKILKRVKIDRVNEKINEIDDIDMIKKGG